MSEVTNPTGEYPAAALKTMALHWLRERYPDALLTTELAIGKYGSASLDAAAITEEEIVGVEVKGTGDSHARLERQGWTYGQRARHLWLLCTPALETACHPRLPEGWGLLEIRRGRVRARRCAKARPRWNAAGALLDILWREELHAVARDLSVPMKARMTCGDLCDAVADAVPLGEVRRQVCGRLRARAWHAMMNGRCKTVYRAGEALPPLYEEASR